MTKTTQPQPTTADDLARLRDTDQLSWAKVAQALGLGSPGAARRAYSAAVRPHTESVLARRTTSALMPVDLAAADLDTLRDTLTARTLVVQRGDRTEDITCTKITSLKNGTINFNDGNKARSVKAAAIIALR
ncbi:MAG: hypothetical protein QM733_15715 [Ilumatobacteraceae bacterium]